MIPGNHENLTQSRRDAEKERRGAEKAKKENGAGSTVGDDTINTANTHPKNKKKTAFSWMKADQIEERMGMLEEQVSEIDRALADPEVWLDHEKANGLTEKRDSLKAELGELETEWLRKAE